MTVQEISGSDYFHPVHVTYSEDEGRSWAEPTEISTLGRVHIKDDIYESVCDVVPDYHLNTGTVLAIGHNVFQKGERFLDSSGTFKKEDCDASLKRYSVYSVFKNGQWGVKKKLYYEEFDNLPSFVCGCTQKIILENGDILIPCSFAIERGLSPRSVTTLLCQFDGDEIMVKERGSIMSLPVRRGFGEPSLVKFDDLYYITLRAEDNHGHVSASMDGLNWGEPKKWQWDDGEEINMYSTQQHWLVHNEELYLVYNRKTEVNREVMRWRSPLFIAQVDVKNLRLKKDTEQIVFPLVGDGVNNAKEVPLMGNFHVTQVSPKKSIITVGEMCPYNEYRGDTLVAYIQ
jgi:hypothetical protein